MPTLYIILAHFLNSGSILEALIYHDFNYRKVRYNNKTHTLRWNNKTYTVLISFAIGLRWVGAYVTIGVSL